MKPRGIWIAIGIILVIGSLSTDYVKKRTAGSEETAAAVPEAASGFAGIPSAREGTDGEPLQEFSMDGKKSDDFISRALEPARENPPCEEGQKQNKESFSTATASESGSAVITRQRMDIAVDPAEVNPSLTQEDADWSEIPQKEEGSPDNPVLIRLQELDGQIAINQSRESENTTNSRKASSENEWMLWETELQRILGILKEKLDSQAQEALMHEQIEWMKSREEEAVDASRKELGGTMEEVNYNRSRAQRTRSRAYELAETYADLFRE